MLDDFGKSRPQFGGGEGVKEIGGYPGGCRHGERANVILYGANINTGLSTDAGIHHGKQGGGDEDKVNSALEGGRTKAAKVPGYTSAKNQQEGVPVKVGIGEVLPKALAGFKVLMLLPFRYLENMVAGQLISYFFITVFSGIWINQNPHGSIFPEKGFGKYGGLLNADWRHRLEQPK